MKILSTVWALFDIDKRPFSVMRNGGSIMIADICEYIGRKEQSYVFTGNQMTEASRFQNIHIVDNSAYLPRKRTADNIQEWQSGLQRRFKEVLEELRPDYVLVQGGREFSTNCILECKHKDQPYAYVDHLMQSGQSAYSFSLEDIEWEKSIFQTPDIQIIAVGNGMRKKILSDNPQLEDEQVVVIPNGTPLCMSPFRNDTSLYSNEKRKILLCCGSLQPRKNQMQLINAFGLLPQAVREGALVLFCGGSPKKFGYGDKLQKRIHECGYEHNMKYIGELSRDEMSELYARIDGLIMPSLSEGLSLVALEAMRFGKPVIMFADNETAEDIKDEQVVVLSKSHSDKALSNAIIEWFSRTWDAEHIIAYSAYYSMERVADDYIKLCNLRRKKN